MLLLGSVAAKLSPLGLLLLRWMASYSCRCRAVNVPIPDALMVSCGNPARSRDGGGGGSSSGGGWGAEGADGGYSCCCGGGGGRCE